jgi:hypothetical protein
MIFDNKEPFDCFDRKLSWSINGVENRQTVLKFTNISRFNRRGEDGASSPQKEEGMLMKSQKVRTLACWRLHFMNSVRLEEQNRKVGFLGKNPLAMVI